MSERAKGAKSPADIRAIIAEGKKQVPLPKEVAPPDAGVTPAEAAPETPAEAEGTAPVEEESTETAEQPETPEGDEDADDDDGGDSIKPSTAKKLRLRLPENDQVGRLTAAILQRNRDLTLPEAMAMANKQLGIKPAAEAAPDAPATPKSDLPPTVEAVDQTLESLEGEMDKAEQELRFEDVGKLRRQIRKLDRHRLTLEREGERQQTEAVQNYERQFTAAEQRAVSLYEFAANPESPGAKRMVEIEADMKETNDPLYFSPDKPLKIAQMVAAELNIAPRRKGAPPAPVKPAAPAPVPAKPKQVLPGGSSRTTAPLANQPPAINAEVAKITTVHGMRNFIKAASRPVR